MKPPSLPGTNGATAPSGTLPGRSEALGFQASPASWSGRLRLRRARSRASLFRAAVNFERDPVVHERVALRAPQTQRYRSVLPIDEVVPHSQAAPARRAAARFTFVR
jgi:hypothetical protein